MAATETDIATYPGRYFAGWNARDPAVVEELVAASFDWQDPSLPAPLTDRAGADAFFAGTWAAFSDLQFIAVGEPLAGTDGRVAAEWRMTGTHDGEFNGVPPTGKAFDVLGTDVFTVGDDGRATAIHAYWDVATLLRQLGLA